MQNIFQRSQEQWHTKRADAKKDSEYAKIRPFLFVTDVGHYGVRSTVDSSTTEPEQEYAEL